MQYRETDFNFVSRLMEQEGIYYYFRHTDGHNTVVLTDSTSKHTATPGYETIPFISPEQVVRPELEHISSWEFAREIQPGVYVHDDYDLERPSVELKTRKALPRSYTPSDYEIYDYPGHYLQKADGEQYAAVRIDEFGSQFETAQAVDQRQGRLRSGRCSRSRTARATDQNREHLILAASYDLEFSDYEAMPEGAARAIGAASSAMSSEQQFRPRRTTPKPFVQGPQTAMVVGPAGDEIYTDKYRPREGAVPLGSLRQEGREQLVLDPRVAAVGRQGLGRGLDAAHRPGGDRRFPRGRSRPADHHRPRVQRREPAAVRLPGRRGPERHEVADAQGSRLQRDVDGRHGRQGEGHHPRPVRHGHDRGEQPDQLGRRGSVEQRWFEPEEEIGANRELSITSNDTVSIGGKRETSIAGTHTVSVGGAEDVSVKGARKATVGGKEDVSIGGASTLQVGGSRSETVKTSHSIVNLSMTITTATQFVASAGSQFTATSPKVNVLAGSKLLVNSGGKADIKAAAGLTQQSGAAMNINAGAALNAQSKAAMNLKSGAALKAQASGAMNLKAGGTLTGKGSSIKLNSPTNIKGTTLTVK